MNNNTASDHRGQQDKSRYNVKCVPKSTNMCGWRNTDLAIEHVLKITLWLINEYTRVPDNPTRRKHDDMSNISDSTNMWMSWRQPNTQQDSLAEITQMHLTVATRHLEQQLKAKPLQPSASVLPEAYHYVCLSVHATQYTKPKDVQADNFWSLKGTVLKGKKRQQFSVLQITGGLKHFVKAGRNKGKCSIANVSTNQ